MILFMLKVVVILTLGGLVWNYVIVLPSSILLSALRINFLKVEAFIFQLAGFYILSSLVILLSVSSAIIHKGARSDFVVYAIVGGIIFFFSSFMNLGSRQRNDVNETAGSAFLALLVCALYYIYASYDPTVSYNALTVQLAEWLNKLLNISIVSWIAYFVSFLYLLNLIFTGGVASLFMIFSLFGKMKKTGAIN